MNKNKETNPWQIISLSKHSFDLSIPELMAHSCMGTTWIYYSKSLHSCLNANMTLGTHACSKTAALIFFSKSQGMAQYHKSICPFFKDNVLLHHKWHQKESQK